MKSFLSQLLFFEHSVILEAEEIILYQNNNRETNPDDYKDQINQLIQFFRIYGDEYHHRKEEEILFPAIQNKSELTGNGIINELLDQHEYFREIMQNIQNALDLDDFAKVQFLFIKYISDLKDHIAIENDELFPMVDTLFTPDELEKLYHKGLDKDRMLGIERKEALGNFVLNYNLNETAQ